MKTFFIKALNTCIMRRQNTQKYSNFLEGLGYTKSNSPDSADVIVVWTCSFRGDVRDVSLNTIFDYSKNLKENQKIYITGCMPDIYPESVKEIESDNIIIIAWKDDDSLFHQHFINENSKTNQQSKLKDFVYIEQQITDDLTAYRKKFPHENVMFCDQFIKVVVSEGCYSKCSYCSERLSFPPYKSAPLEDIIDGCTKIVKETNVFEIALMADSLGEYGLETEGKYGFVSLLEALCNIDDKIKLVLNNFHPKYFMKHFDFLIQLIENGKIKHVNLPMQSASNRILNLMQREYTKENLAQIFDTFNELKFDKFDTHIIVGFPTETEDDVIETIDFLLEKHPAYVLASIYMESPLSDSAKILPKVETDIQKARINKMFEALTASNIIVNADGSPLATDRLNKIRGNV